MEVKKNRYMSLMDLLMELADAIVVEGNHPLLSRIMQTPGLAEAQEAHRSKSTPYGVLQGLVNLTQDMQHFSTVATETGSCCACYVVALRGVRRTDLGCVV